MAFSIFTERTNEPSGRLRFLAGCFRWSAAGAAGATAMLAIGGIFFVATTGALDLFPTVALFAGYAGLMCVSLRAIGRGLLKRQRWSAYLAAITIGTPLIRQLLFPHSGTLGTTGIACATAALCVVVTVWPELGTVRDSELQPDPDEDDTPAFVRRRGYGEPPSLPPHTTPISTTSPSSRPPQYRAR